MNGINDVFAHIPAYPLVFPLFWGSVVYFLLVIARHLRVFAAVRAAGPNPLAGIPLRVGGIVRYTLLQTKMFKDRRAGIMHFGIFWGFVLLTIGTANIVIGGLIQAVLSIPFGGVLWTFIAAMQNLIALVVLAAVGYALVRRLITRPRRLAYTRGALIILFLIGGVVLTELLAQAFESAYYGAVPGAFVANALAVPLGSLSPQVLLDAFTVLWWGHIVIVAAFVCYLPGQQASPHRDGLLQCLLPQARPAGRAAGDGPRGGGRLVRAADAPGPRLEGPPRRVHLHRVRAVHRRLPGQPDRQAAQPARDDHGPAPHGRRR